MSPNSRLPLPGRLILPALALVVAACGERTEQAGQPQAAPAAAPTVAVTPAPTGPIDEALAAQGAELFQQKACASCHRVGGGRLTGPDLEDVTERRAYNWIMAMITKPDSMLKVDATARQLLMEYATPMANMNVSTDEARALYEFLRRDSQ
ncbi:MAG: cytochrome c [Gemmatimonadota bacterium]|nr:cytochrome c [Gemmatimonadota bacterium]